MPAYLDVFPNLHILLGRSLSGKLNNLMPCTVQFTNSDYVDFEEKLHLPHCNLLHAKHAVCICLIQAITERQCHKRCTLSNVKNPL